MKTIIKIAIIKLLLGTKWRESNDIECQMSVAYLLSAIPHLPKTEAKRRKKKKHKSEKWADNVRFFFVVVD